MRALLPARTRCSRAGAARSSRCSCPASHTPRCLRAVAEAIREAVRGERLATRRGALAVTISCGGVLSRSGSDIDELVHAADAAMYRAKQTGSRPHAARRVTRRGGARRQARAAAARAELRAHREHPRGRARGALRRGRGARRRRSPRGSTSPPRPCCAAGSRAGSTTSARSRSRTACSAKPGPLTAEEWRVMVTHAAFGADLVARTPGIAESASAVRHHHERWDGAGYPDRLAGKAIPLEARVVAAADTWNAMTHDRVYRRALDFEAACAELARDRRLATRPAHRRGAARDRPRRARAAPRAAASRLGAATRRRAARRCGRRSRPRRRRRPRT